MLHKKNIHDLIAEISQQLSVLGLEKHATEQEAWWMLEKITSKKHPELLVDVEIAWKNAEATLLQEWLVQRVRDKKPLQYILGSVPFTDLEILVEPPILIPRPETEEMTLWLIEQLKPYKEHTLRVLDICCGTGCIGLAIAKHFPTWQVVGLDIDAQAIALAEKNKMHNNINNCTFGLSNLFDSLVDDSFDIIISNPPYLAEKEHAVLDDQVKEWEDYKALVAGPEGTEMYHKIVQHAKQFLREGRGYPQLVFEIGWEQEVVQQIMHDAGYNNVELFYDLQEKPRWISATL